MDSLSPVSPFAIPSADVPMDRRPMLVYLASLRAGPSRDSVRYRLETLARLLSPNFPLPADQFPWSRVQYHHAQALRTLLEQKYSPSSVNTFLIALRGVLREAFRLGQISAEEYHRTKAIQGVKATRLPRGRALTEEELEKLFDGCDPGIRMGARNAALLGILYGCGLRVTEAIHLRVQDYHPETASLRVLGKGNKERIAHLPPEAKMAIDQWIRKRAEVASIAMGDSLLSRYDTESTKLNRRLTRAGVSKILKSLAKKVGVRVFATHDLRRTFISKMLDLKVDLATVSSMAGHRDVTTTARYDRRGESARARAAQCLVIPYRHCVDKGK